MNNLYYGFYHRKCADNDVLRFLDWNIGVSTDNNYTDNIIDICRDKPFAVYSKDNDCYVFVDKKDIFSLANDRRIPDEVSEYIYDSYSDKTPILIVWCR